ncbi:M23 family metallopeptidase [Pseudoalteromonas tunicata]|uniref:M23 family metallopeptidase n=1 Tax=Pseudoalteromonas tunicata TaxID=314281 RepID=UPI00273F5607|nr:peptidoglycan DD-metalloendopeptidase family protein [Pseudoalteromonas tunicata]MDP4985646.1 peptidoglycan DD-metalloendopeptidase family protein [Pseudoalteromonas tunicata]MDP5214894.1 peptidoglycan DD-metalloendopeptidase family protein [Pseudoalteromonas tunicata]
MKKHQQIAKLSSATLLLASLFSPSIFADSHQKDVFKLSKQHLAALKTNSLQVIDSNTFLFNNQLNQIDWPNYFALHAPSLLAKQEVILHWAGYSSVNPKLLIALIELQSQLISTPDEANVEQPLKGLSNEVGFDKQVKDIALQLSARFYAFEQALSDNKISQLQSNTPATLALQSLFSASEQQTEQTNQPAQSKFNQLLSSYAQISNGESLLIDINNRQLAASEQASIQAASFYMSFPWPSGSAWYSGGAHSNTGSGYPFSSLDFNNGSGGWGSNTPWVQASHGGQVTRYSACNIRVTHSSGYATSYYHMDNVQYNTGDVISAGAWLGRYANNYSAALCEGGQSSGPHVHWSLLYNGRFISLQNAYISGYRVDVGNSNYDDYCSNFYFEKNGYRTCAWSPLYR